MKAQHYTHKQIDSINDNISDLIQENAQKALGEVHKMYKYSEDINYSQGKIQSLENFSYAYYILGDFKKVIEYSTKEEEMALEAKNYKFLCGALRMKAAAYATMGFYEEAKSEVRKAFKYAEKIQEPDKYHGRRSVLYDTYGYIESYNPAGADTDSMFIWRKKSIKEQLKIKKLDLRSLIIPYNNLAMSYIDRKEYDSANIYLNKSLALNHQYPNQFNEPNIWFQFARISKLQNNYLEAIELYQKAYLASLKSKDVYLTRTILQNLYECYAKVGDKENADKYYVKWNTIKDSLTKTEKKNINIPLKEIVKEKEKKFQSEKKYLYYYLGIAFLLLISSVYFIRRYISNYYKERQQKEETKLDLIQKEEKLSELELKMNDAFEEVLELAKKDDSAFLARFKEVYPEFYQKLVSTYPGMTNGQIKFCAQLKLNFSTKEIAYFNHLSVRSVEMKKNRLRKQLNIPSDIDLNKWMMDL